MLWESSGARALSRVRRAGLRTTCFRILQNVRHSAVVCSECAMDDGEPVVLEAYIRVAGHVEGACGVTQSVDKPRNRDRAKL